MTTTRPFPHQKLENLCHTLISPRGPLVAMTMLVVVLATKSLSKQLQNLKRFV